MPSADVRIANRAFGLLREDPMIDFGDDTKAAGLASREYEPCVLGLFEGHDWNFASTRVANLPALADPPLWDYEHAFQLPANCVRVRETSLDRANGGDGDRWTVEGRTLVCDVSALSIRYTRRVLEAEWSALFEDAVVFTLASRFAYGLTGHASLIPDLVKQAAAALRLAKANDGQQGSPRRYVTDALTRDRA